jgi:hypothetical protein
VSRLSPGADDVRPEARALLTRLFDYAGLFPPAGLGMPETVRNFEAYRRGPHAWMLGRLVVPWGLRDEFLDALSDDTPRDLPTSDEQGSACPVTLLVPMPGSDAAADRLREEHAEFAEASAGRVEIGALETKVADAAALESLGVAFDLFGDLFPGAVVHVEATGSCHAEAVLDALVHQRARAESGRDPARVLGAGKLRTGSVVPDEIPTVEAVTAFIRACAERDLPWKATAGLHHPLPATRPLTYEPDAPRGPMYGYVGVIMAAARVLDDPDTSAADLRALLTDPDPPPFERVSFESLRAARTLGCLSIGTCSFVEPVEGAESLGLLPNRTERHR